MWINAIDSNKFVDTVYIDFSKAFDTVSHRKLLHKLTNYGITGNILQWFSSFLCDRKQRVKIGDVYSSYASVSSGVPQGSCTGPLLFILYANDLPDSHQGNDTMVCLFADDTKLSRVGETGVGCHTGWLSHCQYLIRWMAVPCGGLHVTCA